MYFDRILWEVLVIAPVTTRLNVRGRQWQEVKRVVVAGVPRTTRLVMHLAMIGMLDKYPVTSAILPRGIGPSSSPAQQLDTAQQGRYRRALGEQCPEYSGDGGHADNQERCSHFAHGKGTGDCS